MKLYELIQKESISNDTIPVCVIVESLYDKEVEFLYHGVGRCNVRYYRVVGQRTVIKIESWRICSIVYDAYTVSVRNYAPYNVVKRNGEIEACMDANTGLEEHLVEDGISIDKDGERLWEKLYSKSGNLAGVSVLRKEHFGDYKIDTLDAFEHPTGRFYSGSTFRVVPRLDQLNEFEGNIPTYNSGMTYDDGVDLNLLLEIKKAAPDYNSWWVDWKRIRIMAEENLCREATPSWSK